MASKGRRVTADIMDPLIERYRNGESANALATEAGMSSNTIRLHLIRRGVPVRNLRDSHQGTTGLHTKGWERQSMPKAVSRPSTIELGWIAGFLDGEGSFSTAGTKNYPCETVGASQVERDPLERLQRALGGTIREKKNSANGFGGRGCGMIREWKVYGSRARGVMLTVYPLMSERRQGQIRAALTRKAG